jgi:hypothetical protein
MTRARKIAGGAAAGAVAAVAVLGGVALTVSEDTTEPPAQTLTAVDPSPQPPWGARVYLGGKDGMNCSQAATIVARTTTPGILFVRGPGGESWVTKTATLIQGENPSPPFIKARLTPGAWVVQNSFPAPIKYRLWFANSNCLRADGLGAKWNATVVTVTVNAP